MIFVLVLVVLALGAAAFVKHRLNDDRVPVAASLLAPDETPSLMAIWAHPDDEITAAGTLAMAGLFGHANVTLVYLTAGEGARDSGLSREELARVRRAEAQAAGSVLGARHTEVLDFPDGGLDDGWRGRAIGEIGALIDRHRPTCLISFDETIGYYGHPDHVCVGRWVRDIFEARRGDPEFAPRRLYQATLPANLIALARRHVSAFRDRYPEDPAQGLPGPTVAVRIGRAAGVKRRLLDVHESQARVIRDVQPYFDRVPAAVYYHFFDREYFALAASR